LADGRYSAWWGGADASRFIAQTVGGCCALHISARIIQSVALAIEASIIRARHAARSTIAKHGVCACAVVASAGVLIAIHVSRAVAGHTSATVSSDGLNINIDLSFGVGADAYIAYLSLLNGNSHSGALDCREAAIYTTQCTHSRVTVFGVATVTSEDIDNGALTSDKTSQLIVQNGEVSRNIACGSTKAISAVDILSRNRLTFSVR